MFSIYAFLLGICIGSFLNVVICRLETKESILFNRSYCPRCRAVLKWYDLIPVLSFILLRAKCRYCGKKISWQYPIVEIFTGVIFLLIFSFSFAQDKNFNFINLFYYLAIACFLIIIFTYDLKHYIIPDKIVYPAIIIALIYQIISVNLLNPLLSAMSAGGFFLSLILISKGRWMGLGDVKLAFLMGLILGWPNILAALFLAFLSGAVIGIGLVIGGKKKIKSEIPFGPFLAGATVLVMLIGQYLADWHKILFYF